MIIDGRFKPDEYCLCLPAGMVTFKFDPRKSPKNQEKYNLGEGLKQAFKRTELDLLNDSATKTALPELRASTMSMSNAERIEVMGMVKEVSSVSYWAYVLPYSSHPGVLIAAHHFHVLGTSDYR